MYALEIVQYCRTLLSGVCQIVQEPNTAVLKKILFRPNSVGMSQCGQGRRALKVGLPPEEIHSICHDLCHIARQAAGQAKLLQSEASLGSRTRRRRVFAAFCPASPHQPLACPHQRLAGRMLAEFHLPDATLSTFSL